MNERESDDFLDEAQLSEREDELSLADRRVLRELASELRAQPAPSLDWERVERGLLARLDGEAGALPTAREASARERRRLISGLTIAVAAAAIILLAFSGLFDAASTVPRGANGDVDLTQIAKTEAGYRVDVLTPKSAVESADDPVTFTLPGVVTWTLAPHSRVIVDTVSVPHALALERGRIDAEVVPRELNDPESGHLVEAFVITAGSARVAVRGTVFSVERDEAAVTVEVTRGKVAVGPQHPHGDDGAVELLVGPARARFSLEGGRLLARSTEPDPSSAQRRTPASLEHRERGYRAEAAPARGGEGAPDHGSAAPAVPPADHDEPSAKLPAADPSAAPEGAARISVDQARAMVLGCLRQALARDDGDDRAVTVSSAVTVTLGPEGRVDAVRFSPPLRPDLQQRCGGALFGQSLSADGKAHFDVQVTR